MEQWIIIVAIIMIMIIIFFGEGSASIGVLGRAI